ncbi:MAG: DUF4956 domain-containing protein [Flavobacteriaceae bacterium]|jgi:hypothetical protein|nr:DUF4956 domain-containing protein [Flavobacteriaceae bacterium]
MELLGIPLFDDDFYKMMIRFLLNLFFLTGIIKFVYYKRNPKKEYLFTFYLIGIVVYFLCFTLKKYELDLGMALGLFAIFGIIRYRTLPLEVKEMTYLFVVIGVAVMNALSNKKMSYAEIIAANTIILLALHFLERYWARTETLSKDVIYEIIENIRPENHDKLKADLEKRLGVEILSFEIGKVNFLKDVAKVTVYYKP